MDAKRTSQSVERVVTELRRRAHRERHASRSVVTRAVTVRLAAAGDEISLERLARLDSASVPTGATLVAEFGGELVAALSLDGGRAIANPFRHTDEVVRELELQAAELSGARTRLRPTLRPGYAGWIAPVSAS
jgi:hypothetical protein